eukprot:3628409-Alexandrium_andersonii.AAC.1
MPPRVLTEDELAQAMEQGTTDLKWVLAESGVSPTTFKDYCSGPASRPWRTSAASVSRASRSVPLWRPTWSSRPPTARSSAC